MIILLLLSCAHHEEPSADKGKSIISQMTAEEKYRILRSYRFLQNLAGGPPGTMPISEGYLPGIPRLGIPSIELVGVNRPSRQVAREEKTLKLGFVKLIRDFEKTQVIGNFSAAGAVDQIMEPDKTGEIRKFVKQNELGDLDLFLVQESHEGKVRNYVCAQYREDDEFACVPGRLEKVLNQMGITQEYDELLALEKLNKRQLDRLTSEVLGMMDELKIL